MIYLNNRTCLNCKRFRLEDTLSGVCRRDKSVAEYPRKLTEDSCENWLDAGQQYYIRLGWIKKTRKNNESPAQ